MKGRSQNIFHMIQNAGPRGAQPTEIRNLSSRIKSPRKTKTPGPSHLGFKRQALVPNRTETITHIQKRKEKKQTLYSSDKIVSVFQL
jgi:hypothetical protein